MTRSIDLRGAVCARAAIGSAGRRFWCDGRGNIGIAVCIMIAPLMFAVGMAVDAVNINNLKSQAQAALDGATLEIALNLNVADSHSSLEAIGRTFYAVNMQLDVESELVSLTYLGAEVDESGTQSVTARATYRYNHLIPRSFGEGTAGEIQLNVISRISARQADGACIYALNKNASRAFEAAGNTIVDVNGCVIASNSSAADGIYVGGSASVSADCAQSSGGIDATEGLVTDCGANRENAWRLADPLAGMIEPIPPILRSNPKKSDTNVEAGRYKDLSLDGEKTLQPGLYYIEGSLSIKGTVLGEGVTIYMADGGINVNASASLSLSAPHEGDYAGILFWAAQSNTSAHVFNGNGATDIDGFLYFPKGAVDYLGNSGATSTCLRIVADTIKLSGSSMVRSDCAEELGGREARVSGPLYYSR